MEQFWTDAAGSRDRARDAIAGYYGRVESANRHFTSYTEGWKTDRGLVHIIFGTPTTIRKDGRSETWIYGDETNLMSLVFNFVRRDEPFSDNDLVSRDPRLKSAWYRNVESWRNGRILQRAGVHHVRHSSGRQRLGRKRIDGWRLELVNDD